MTPPDVHVQPGPHATHASILHGTDATCASTVHVTLAGLCRRGQARTSRDTGTVSQQGCPAVSLAVVPPSNIGSRVGTMQLSAHQQRRQQATGLHDRAPAHQSPVLSTPFPRACSIHRPDRMPRCGSEPTCRHCATADAFPSHLPRPAGNAHVCRALWHACTQNSTFEGLARPRLAK